jgi:hypothetical protein
MVIEIPGLSVSRPSHVNFDSTTILGGKAETNSAAQINCVVDFAFFTSAAVSLL